MKGSFTLEAALLSSIMLTVIMIAIYLQLYMFETAWYTAAAWEEIVTAVTANAGDEDAEESIKISYAGVFSVPYAGKDMSYEIEEEGKVINPVSHIRRVKALQQLWGKD